MIPFLLKGALEEIFRMRLFEVKMDILFHALPNPDPTRSGKPNNTAFLWMQILCCCLVVKKN
jgi:hypothetical protein